MSDSRPPRAVLDSDIIFSRVLHELLGRVARRLRLLDLVWSAQLLAEAKRSLIVRKGLSEEVATRWVGYLPQNFPDGRTEIEAALQGEEIGSLTVDADDRHVCALALAAGARYLFTHDRGYLREALAAHKVEVVRPEGFLLGAFDEQPGAISELLSLQASTWAGGRPLAELLDAIQRAGAPALAARVRARTKT